MKETTVFRIEKAIFEQFIPGRLNPKFGVLIDSNCPFTDSEGNMIQTDCVVFSCFCTRVTAAEYNAMVAPFVKQFDSRLVLRIDKEEGRVYLVKDALKTMFPNTDKVAKEKKPAVRLSQDSKVDAEHASYAYMHSADLLLQSAAELVVCAQDTYPQSDNDSPAKTMMFELQDKLLALSTKIDKFINS